MHTLIIGGGAAGMAAAIAAAENGQHVTVLERGRKVLKKLGVTGNGRGNLLNAGKPQYFGDEAFALEVLGHMPYERIAAFLRSCGIALTEEEEGRIYPSSYLAASAVDALQLRAEQLGVRIKVNTRVTRVEHGFAGNFRIAAVEAVYEADTQRKNGKNKPGALIGEKPVFYSADRVIVTVGGAAAPVHGTDGSAYELLTSFGHRVTEPHPALCALTTTSPFPAFICGQRVRCTLTLIDLEKHERHVSSGEALFAEDGVSGIAAMQLARFVRPDCLLQMDLREAVMGDEQNQNTEQWLKNRMASRRTMGELLVGAASPALNQLLLSRSGLNPSEPASGQDLAVLAANMEMLLLRLSGTRGFDMAQVTAGGVKTEDFDSATMESRLVPGVYAAGEVLDVDGACGGFNLMFAFATGLIAGKGTH